MLPGINYKIIRLPAGEYLWNKLRTKSGDKYSLKDAEFRIEVAAGTLNYSGHLMGSYSKTLYAAPDGDWYRFRRQNFRLKNRATLALDYLLSCCGTLLAEVGLNRAANFADSFINYYLEKVSNTPPAANATVNKQTDTNAEIDEDNAKAIRLSESFKKDMAVDFIRRKKVLDARISPNGERVAFYEIIDDERNLMVVNLALRKKYVVVDSMAATRYKAKFGNLYWVDNERIIFEIFRVRNQIISLVTILDDQEEPEIRLNNVIYADVLIIDALPMEDKQIIIARRYKGRSELFKIDVTAEKKSQKKLKSRKSLIKGVEDSFGWWADNRGVVRLAGSVDEETGQRQLYLRRQSTNEWHVVWQSVGEIDFSPVTLSEDEQFLFAITNAESDHKQLVRYNIAEQRIDDVIFRLKVQIYHRPT